MVGPREVPLPPDVPGGLWLDEMPGRHEPFDAFRNWARQYRLERVVRLSPLEEAQHKSPGYFEAIRGGGLPWRDDPLEVPDFGVPHDREAWLDKVREIAGALRAGERVLVHCGAGIGRTGTFAICVLVALGVDPSEARTIVARVGSRPETDAQRDLVAWTAGRLLDEA